MSNRDRESVAPARLRALGSAAWTAQRITPADVVHRIPEAATVFVEQGPAEPRGLVRSLIDGADKLRRIRLLAAPVPGCNDCAFLEVGASAAGNDSRIYSFFGGKDVARAMESCGVHYVPIHWSQIPEALQTRYRPDVALLRVTPPDPDGRCWLGPTASFEAGVAATARVVIAEVDPDLPRVAGDTTIDAKEVDYFIDANEPLREGAQGRTTATDVRLAEHVLSLVPEGAVLQIGIGAMPQAVLEQLGDSALNVSFHSAIVSDQMLNIAGSQTPVVGAMLLGSRDLYRDADQRPNLSLRRVEMTHGIRTVASYKRFVAINSAVEIDLLGQVNAEQVDGRQRAGVGGQVDFIRGAAASAGGRSIIALRSRTAHASKIVAALPSGTPVSTSRVDVDYVVTEHGVAELRHRSVAERAAALVSIADPEFKPELAAAAEALVTGFRSPTAHANG